MNLNKWLAALFVMLALAGCAQAATEQGQVSTPERKYIGGRSKNASRTDAKRAAADARPRPGRVPSSALQFDQ